MSRCQSKDTVLDTALPGAAEARGSGGLWSVIALCNLSLSGSRVPWKSQIEVFDESHLLATLPGPRVSTPVRAFERTTEAQGACCRHVGRQKLILAKINDDKNSLPSRG